MGEKRVGCLVMAAGNAARFGDNKLAARLEGRSLIERALDAAAGADFHRVAVVSQYPEVEELSRAWGYLSIHNEHPDWGISHTIRLGTQALGDCDAILYMVADQPLLSRASVGRVVRRWRERPDCIAAAGHDGRRGNPCLFPREFFPELMALEEDCGGSTVIRAHEERLVLTEIPEAELSDVDTQEALRELRRKRRAATSAHTASSREAGSSAASRHI